MTSLLQALMELFGRFTFFVIIASYEKGVVLRCGKLQRILEPGFHWVTPVFDEVLTRAVIPVVLDLPTVSVETRAGRSIGASGNLEYDITDIESALLDVQNLTESLSRMAWGVVATTVAELDAPGIAVHELAETVAQKIHQRASVWGVRVTEFWFTDYGPHKVYRIIGDGSRPVVVPT